MLRGCLGGGMQWGDVGSGLCSGAAGSGDSGLQLLSQRGSLPGLGRGLWSRDEEEEEEDVMEEMRCGLCWGSGPALWVEGLGGLQAGLQGRGLGTGCCGWKGALTPRHRCRELGQTCRSTRCWGLPKKGSCPGWVCGQLLAPQRSLRCAGLGKASAWLKGPPGLPLG